MMHIKRTLLALVLVTALLITGCYSPGKVSDGVYSNNYFKVTTPEQFTCFTGQDVEKSSSYYFLYALSESRGTNKSFKCEYAADAGTADMLVCSEENPGKMSMDEFAARITKQMEGCILLYSENENKDVVIDGLTFRKLTYSTFGCMSYYFIREQGGNFIYLYVNVLDNDFIDAGPAALDSITHA